MLGPRLPDRSRNKAATGKAAGQQRATTAMHQQPHQHLQDLQQQLNSNPLFQQFVDQPDKLLSVLQSDRVLADAAASNPEIATLLDPSTLKQALAVLQGSTAAQHGENPSTNTQDGVPAGAGATAPPVVQRKALMQLQNYAMQLQQARAAGMLATPSPHQQHQQPFQQQQQGGSSTSQLTSTAAAGAPDAAGGGGGGGEAWAALQQQLTKLQQRSSMLGGPVMAGPDLAPEMQPHGVFAQQQGPWPPATPAAAQQPHPNQLQQQEQHQQQHQVFSQAQLPHHQHQLRAAGGSSSGSPAASPRMVHALHLARLSMSGDGGSNIGGGIAAAAGGGGGGGQHQGASYHGGSSSSNRAMSPLGPWGATSPAAAAMAAATAGSLSLLGANNVHHHQHHGLLQQHHSDGWGGGGGGCGGSSSSGQFSPAAAGVSALQRRSSSSLSHRVLRHTAAASPNDLQQQLERSGSHALSIERLESGDVIVDITPPTRVTQGLAWSTDPTAAYVLDAAASGSFSQLVASDSGEQLPVSTPLAAAASEPTAGAGAGSSVAGGSSAAGAGASGVDEQLQLFALPLLGTPDVQQQPSAAADSNSNSNSSGKTAAAGGGAVASGRRSTGNSSSSSSGRQRGSPPKLQLRVAAAAGQQRVHQQQQQQSQQAQQSEHYSFVNLSDGAATNSSSYASAQHQQQPQQQQQQQYGSGVGAAGAAAAGSWYGAAAADAGPTAAAAAALTGSYDPRTYYESVAPSTWRPTDVGSAPGDYLELYRRAYCTYADALFPPLWMALIATLSALQLLPFWQLSLLALATFWGGLWLMAIKWAGVAPSHLGLSRVTPVMTVCLELVCTGAFISQVLPVMWLGHSLVCATLLVCCGGMLLLHLTAFLQDPGYTPLPAAGDAEEGLYARHLAATANNTNSSASSSHQQGASSPAAAGAAAPAASEQTPLLGHAAAATIKQQQQQGGSASGSGGGAAASGGAQQQQQQPAWGGLPMDHCWTCRVKRNMRSKHCPLCKRCVERFDHHCPVLGNCVGAGNHKTFVAFLAVMLLSQLLFCQVVTSMLTQSYLLQHTQQTAVQSAAVQSAAVPGLVGGSTSSGSVGVDVAGSVLSAAAGEVVVGGSTSTVANGDQAGPSSSSSSDGTPSITGSGASAAAATQAEASGASAAAAAAAPTQSSHQRGMWLTLQALWAAASTHMGLLLLLIAQVPTMLMSSFLLFRALGLAAANLTVNEWLNRHRYVHLHYTGAGFSNRFDRGIATNCYDFWCGPKFVDYWEAWDAAEQEMKRRGLTVLLPRSATVLIRYWDLKWSQYQQHLTTGRQRRRELQMQRRMQALGLDR